VLYSLFCFYSVRCRYRVSNNLTNAGSDLHTFHINGHWVCISKPFQKRRLTCCNFSPADVAILRLHQPHVSLSAIMSYIIVRSLRWLRRAVRRSNPHARIGDISRVRGYRLVRLFGTAIWKVCRFIFIFCGRWRDLSWWQPSIKRVSVKYLQQGKADFAHNITIISSGLIEKYFIYILTFSVLIIPDFVLANKFTIKHNMFSWTARSEVASIHEGETGVVTFVFTKPKNWVKVRKRSGIRQPE